MKPYKFLIFATYVLSLCSCTSSFQSLKDLSPELLDLISGTWIGDPAPKRGLEKYYRNIQEHTIVPKELNFKNVNSAICIYLNSSATLCCGGFGISFDYEIADIALALENGFLDKSDLKYIRISKNNSKVKTTVGEYSLYKVFNLCDSNDCLGMLINVPFDAKEKNISLDFSSTVPEKNRFLGIYEPNCERKYYYQTELEYNRFCIEKEENLDVINTIFSYYGEMPIYEREDYAFFEPSIMELEDLSVPGGYGYYKVKYDYQILKGLLEM